MHKIVNAEARRQLKQMRVQGDPYGRPEGSSGEELIRSQEALELLVKLGWVDRAATELYELTAAGRVVTEAEISRALPID